MFFVRADLAGGGGGGVRCASLLPNDPYQEGSLPHTATLGTTPLRGTDASSQPRVRVGVTTVRGGSLAREGQLLWPQLRGAAAAGGSDDEAKFTLAGDDAILGRPP